MLGGVVFSCQQIGVNTFYKRIEFQVNSFDSYWEILIMLKKNIPNFYVQMYYVETRADNSGYTNHRIICLVVITGTWPMDLNFPVCATGLRIFRASNDVGPLFLGPGSTRMLEINTRWATKWRCTAKFLIIVDFPDFWKINGWNTLTLWTPISCCAPGLLSCSYYFAYIPPETCSHDRLST